MAKIDQILSIVKAAGASDLHLSAGSAPMIRVAGELQKTKHRKLSNGDIRQLTYELLSDEQIRRFEKHGDLDLAYGIPDVARFRINLYRTHMGQAAAIRLIPEDLSDLQSLGFPETLNKLAQNKAGLVLVTGPTNSGKTTTLASMIDFINSNTAKHIISLEDPIEYVHENKNSLISQRQVGTHSESFAFGLRAALREDPDVIMVGEMRDLETISLAVTAAEVGLLVMGTLHTATAASTIDRVIDVFPPDQQHQIRVMLAESLRGTISQHLLRRADGLGRVVACEIMLNTTAISAMIRDGKSHQITTAIQTGGKHGMQLLDTHLRTLVDSGAVTAQEAMRCAVDPKRFQESDRKVQQLEEAMA